MILVHSTFMRVQRSYQPRKLRTRPAMAPCVFGEWANSIRTHLYGRVHNVTQQNIACFVFGQQSFAPSHPWIHYDGYKGTTDSVGWLPLCVVCVSAVYCIHFNRRGAKNAEKTRINSRRLAITRIAGILRQRLVRGGLMADPAPI